MALGEAFVTVMGTTVVVALAVGAAIGTHALVGEPVTDVSPTASATPTPDGTLAMSDDFCTLMNEMTVFVSEQSAAISESGNALDLNSGENPVVLEAIHAQGQATQEFSDTYVSYQNHAADLISDPEIARAFREVAAGTMIQLESYAHISLDATSVAGFISAAFGTTLTPAEQDLVDSAEAASDVYTEYVRDECGLDLESIFVSDDASSQVVGAKADVSTLGKEMATYFVDWTEGDPQPEVTLKDGEYFLGDVLIGIASDGVTLVDQYSNGPADWCVAVSSGGADPVSYGYSARYGMFDGTCAETFDD